MACVLQADSTLCSFGSAVHGKHGEAVLSASWHVQRVLGPLAKTIIADSDLTSVLLHAATADVMWVVPKQKRALPPPFISCFLFFLFFLPAFSCSCSCSVFFFLSGADGIAWPCGAQVTAGCEATRCSSPPLACCREPSARVFGAVAAAGVALQRKTLDLHGRVACST